MYENEHVKLSCEIVKDLLPLYHDRVVSQATSAAVEEHLAGCESCREEYEALCDALPEQEKTPSTREKFLAMVRRQKKKRLLALALAVVLAVGAVAGGIAALSELCLVDLRPAQYEVRKVCRIDTEEGPQLFLLWNDTWGGYASITDRKEVREGEKSVLAVHKRRPLLTWGTGVGHDHSQWMFVPDDQDYSAVTFNGETVWTAAETEEAPGFVYELWDIEQQMRLDGGGAMGYEFAEEYVYLSYNGQEQYWSWDGGPLEGSPDGE